MTEATGGELLTLWKVGRVELPKIAQVYLDAIDGLATARDAAAAYFEPSAAGAPESTAGQVGPAWQRVCDELTDTLSQCARNTLAGADAVGRAISEHTRTDADGTGSPTDARARPVRAGSMIRMRSTPLIRTRIPWASLPPSLRLTIARPRPRDPGGRLRNPAIWPG